MKANKQIRDQRRKSKRRLYVVVDGVEYGSTTFPVASGAKENSVQSRTR